MLPMILINSPFKILSQWHLELLGNGGHYLVADIAPVLHSCHNTGVSNTDDMLVSDQIVDLR